MSWVAVAIGGIGTIAGTQLYGASQAAGAVEEGANIAADAAGRGQQLQQQMFLQSMRTLQPFVNLGLGAGSTLANQVVSPQERQRQYESQFVELEGQIQRLSRPLGFNDVPQVFGEKGSERWAAAVNAANASRTSELSEVQSKLDTLKKQAQLDLTQSTAREAEGIQASPLYEFQRELGERNIKRQLSATGRLDTGFGAETLSNFYRALGAEETERQTGRLMNLTTIGANAAAQQASNTVNAGNTQAGLLQQAGQFQGTGVSQAGQISGAGIQGIGKTASQVGLLALLAGNAGLFSGGGDPTALGGTASTPGTGSLVNVRGSQPAFFQSGY